MDLTMSGSVYHAPHRMLAGGRVSRSPRSVITVSLTDEGKSVVRLIDLVYESGVLCYRVDSVVYVLRFLSQLTEG
jgi:hypothetical protein